MALLQPYCPYCKADTVRRSRRTHKNREGGLLRHLYRCKSCQRHFFAIEPKRLWIALSALTLVITAVVGVSIYRGNKMYTPGKSETVSRTGPPVQLLDAAGNGDRVARYALAMLYLEGDAQVTANPQEAFKWMQLSAQQGYPKAEYQLGMFYRDGKGTLQDFSSAFQWLTKAAKHGYADGQYQLGMAYFHGDGVTIDFKQAYAWMSLASTGGVAKAASSRDEVARHMQAADVTAAQELSKTLMPEESAAKAGEDKSAEGKEAVAKDIAKDVASKDAAAKPATTSTTDSAKATDAGKAGTSAASH